MSYQEKRTLMSIITSVLLMVSYSIYAFGKAGMEHINDLQFWAKTILVFIGIGIVVLIILQIVFHILMAISKAIRQKLSENEVDEEEIGRSMRVETTEDEMDKIIEMKSNKFGYTIMGLGFMAGLIAIAFGASAVAMLNILFFSTWTGSLIEALMQIRYYRKGIQ
jgi:Na+-transporting methylmalonyl-CoA/oxaloacetate decarboxylase gamma subunit